MNPPSEDVKTLLAAESSLGLIYGTNLYVGEIPDVGSKIVAPDRCVAVYDTPGFPPEANYEYERPNVQVRVRGNRGDYLGTHNLGQAIRNTLHGLANVTVSGARYVGIWCSSDLFFLGYDSKHRPTFAVNFRLHRTSSA